MNADFYNHIMLTSSPFLVWFGGINNLASLPDETTLHDPKR